MIQAERLILKELGFCVHVKHSHMLAVTYCTLIGVDTINKECASLAWNYCNDAHRTDVFVRYVRARALCPCVCCVRVLCPCVFCVACVCCVCGVRAFVFAYLCLPACLHVHLCVLPVQFEVSTSL